MQNSKETLSDYIADHLHDSDFFDQLDEVLEQMPYSKESVDELLDATFDWDLLSELYYKLFEFDKLLQPDELAKLKKRFQESFDLPLPYYIDE